jgi:hypothetical protein
MLDEKNRTLQAHPSLFPLRAALTSAESRSPARPRSVDSNERLAMQLIARMQAGYRKARPFLKAGKHA